jgi:hypothetical protein
MVRYRFDVVYSAEYVRKANRMLKKLDLEMDFAIKETWEITSLKRNEDIPKVKEALKLVLEDLGCKVWSIEGGIYE